VAHLDKLSASSRHLQALVDDVLDLSQIGAGKLVLDITAFRLEEILNNLQQMFSLPAAQKGLVLSITHTLPAGLWVRGDPLRLKQVLVNVLGNALKFTANGRIAVVVQQVEECRDGYICLHFAVEDKGIGISHAQQQHLFQPFSQADSSTARRYGGSGLGLAISRKLVRLMGGELALVSEPNQGSRFFFTLAFPRQTSTVVEASPASDSSAPPQKLAGLEVLLVDDDALNRYLGHAMLEILGVKATVVDSGQAAIQQVQQHAFDLVMMDVSMPEMDGYTATRHIRTAGYTALPIIAVTAHAIEGEYGRCINAGMNDYLRKPFDLETLHLIILHNLTVAPSQLEYK
jgi:CheY-like chemotaxis protein